MVKYSSGILQETLPVSPSNTLSPHCHQIVFYSMVDILMWTECRYSSKGNCFSICCLEASTDKSKHRVLKYTDLNSDGGGSVGVHVLRCVCLCVCLCSPPRQTGLWFVWSLFHHGSSVFSSLPTAICHCQSVPISHLVIADCANAQIQTHTLNTFTFIRCSYSIPCFLQHFGYTVRHHAFDSWHFITTENWFLHTFNIKV